MSPHLPHHLVDGKVHQQPYHHHHHTNDAATMSDCSIENLDNTNIHSLRTRIRIARAVPFFSLLCNLAFLHLLSDIQADLRLTSTVEVGRILTHRPYRTHGQSVSTNVGSAGEAAGVDSENEWQAYLGALTAIRLCLWASVVGNAMGCYGVLKPSSRFVLFSLLQAHVELLLGLAATIPVLVMTLFPSLFIAIEPIAPIICSEILSHPQAVRDLFEPLRMLTPYDEFAGCDTWVSGVAAPVGLIGVLVWGFVRLKINGLLHLLYHHVRRLGKEKELESRRSFARCGRKSSRGAAIRLSSSDEDDEWISSSQERGEKDIEKMSRTSDNGEHGRSPGEWLDVKVDLVIPNRHERRAAKQTQQPILFAPVPRPRMPIFLRMIQVDLPH